MLNCIIARHRILLLTVCCALLAAGLLRPEIAHAQATLSTGSIQGTIVDPNGGVIATAKVTITNKATGQQVTPEVSSTGGYNSGPLQPGEYTLAIAAQGFKTLNQTITVAVGTVSSGNATLELGSESVVVNVEGSAITVNTEQPSVQGVLTSGQIETLPINGRNFLDLAQLEPGVQVQDGANFDPTKNGFSSISFGGRFGRTARIEVDGVDISDETVGTTTQNIPASAIQEFHVGQSTLDLSTELTSSGSVNVVTRSGSNALHGEGFFYGRDDSMAARIAQTGPSVFTRHQYGANLGGALIKDKLFFFGDFERGMQNLLLPVVMPAPFSLLDGGFNSPFRDLEFLGRLDWQASKNYRAFFRYSYEQNSSVKAFVPNVFQPFRNANNTPAFAGGVDFTTGSFTHSIRAEYLKMRNGINDAVSGSSIFNPAPGIAIAIGGDPVCLTAGADPFCSGPNFLAPQKTFQSNKQIKYDGSRTFGSHILRYGTSVNRIQGAVFAAFIGSAPIAFSAGLPSEVVGTLPGGAGNPLNYSMDVLFLGNGQGFFTEQPGFNFPAGGAADTRFQWYFGDDWKIKPNITLTYGLHYVRDTGRSDSDLPAMDALNQFSAGLGAPVNQPNKNYGPQVGLAWDPTKKGKTVIRAGAGLYYENAIWNNVLFDRPGRLSKGLFLNYALPCPGGSLSLPDGSVVTTVNGHPIAQDCGAAIGQTGAVNVAADAAALETLFQQNTIQAGPQNNAAYIGNAMTAGLYNTGTQLFYPDYRSPRSYQMNIGVQHELRKGTVLSVDYLRNIALHYLLSYDVNHVGDARYLNVPNAQAAINATLAQCGAATIDAAIASCPALHATGGASIADFQANGLDSGNALAGGTPCPTCAFGGINSNYGQLEMLFPGGRSVYNGLDVKLTSELTNPLKGIKYINYQISYSLSRFVSQATDQDLIAFAPDFAHPNAAIGPNSLDRKHQFSAGATMDLPLYTRIGFVTHYYSSLPATLYLPAGSIFTADLSGDGTFGGNTTGGHGDFLPGTTIGSFARDVNVGGLNALITNYNNTIAGKTLTPAGQALVDASLFTQAQLLALGATPQPVQLAPNGQVGLDHFFTFDLRLGWTLRAHKLLKGLPERLVIEPQIQFYNLFNRQNFDSPSQPLSGVLSGAPGSLNGTTRYDQPGCDPGTNPALCTGRTNLASMGSGVFALGAPRQIEWGIKVSF